MKREYDFSNAERGKFYRAGAKMVFPIYLDAALQKQLEPFARNQGKGIGQIVNDILKNQLQLLTSLDRKSTRLNSSHGYISYAVFCLKKKKILHYEIA